MRAVCKARYSSSVMRSAMTREKTLVSMNLTRLLSATGGQPATDPEQPNRSVSGERSEVRFKPG